MSIWKFLDAGSWEKNCVFSLIVILAFAGGVFMGAGPLRELVPSRNSVSVQSLGFQSAIHMSNAILQLNSDSPDLAIGSLKLRVTEIVDAIYSSKRRMNWHGHECNNAAALLALMDQYATNENAHTRLSEMVSANC
ncbi:hypothetical protein [Wenzhouxiangella sediminis]|uniref:hypothetical protein n=1 Tax=Wenzhouxiangella sediminis TaxID=1792836 RepID=UPI0011C04BFF|nr:hypothetical protein [Wenzhouxiangella sediminis]